MATIDAYNPAVDEIQNITTKYNFPISQIASDEKGAIYFFNDMEKTWYVLET